MIESLSFPFSDTVKILGKYFLPSATTNSFIQSNLTSSTSSTTKNTLKIHDIQKSKPVIFLLSFSFFFPSFQCTRQCWLLLPILDFFLLIFNATALSWLYPSASPVEMRFILNTAQAQPLLMTSTTIIFVLAMLLFKQE